MHDILHNEIIRTANLLGIKVVELSLEECARIQAQIKRKFIAGKRTPQMWDALEGCVSIQDRDSWRWIDEFVEDNKAILCVDEGHAEWKLRMYEFNDGQQLVNVLGETFHFEFYVTDRDVSYLLCFNDHDYLIACGRATGWLLALQE